MRELSENFLDALRNGLLQPVLERVKQDHTLMLAIRDGYINIYYRGGNILRVKEQGKGKYNLFFDPQYNKFGTAIPNLPRDIKDPNDVRIWVESFPRLKEIMDFYFSEHPKPEREFQQLVARENNDSTISNESEYFISDIEVAESSHGARFDILAIRWPASQRKKGSRCKAAFIEMKYADGALGGSAGLLKHLKDIDELISNRSRYNDLLLTMQNQFNQLDLLGLLKFNKGRGNATIALNIKDRPEVIFILANHNPRSTKLNTILSHPQFDAADQSQCFDLKFYIANFAGYGLHNDCMLTLSQFRRLLKSNNAGQNPAMDGCSAPIHIHHELGRCTEGSTMVPGERTYLNDHLMVDKDWGSTGLWVKIAGGGWANTQYEWHGVPDWLVERFKYWSDMYERCTPERINEQLNWEIFEAYGLSLAIDLKRVLGPGIHVFHGPDREITS